jgi:hypothetical protein
MFRTCTGMSSEALKKMEDLGANTVSIFEAINNMGNARSVSEETLRNGLTSSAHLPPR